MGRMCSPQLQKWGQITPTEVRVRGEKKKVFQGFRIGAVFKADTGFGTSLGGAQEPFF